MNMESFIGWSIGLIVIGIILITCVGIGQALSKSQKIKTYNNTLCIGMDESVCKELLGPKYTESEFQDGTKKCVWVVEKGAQQEYIVMASPLALMTV